MAKTSSTFVTSIVRSESIRDLKFMNTTVNRISGHNEQLEIAFEN
jgi:hypothetical protein